MIDYPEVSCNRCSERECKKTIIEFEGLPYLECAHTKRKPIPMECNAIIWTLFLLLTTHSIFMQYPFFLKKLLSSLNLKISFEELMRLSELYNRFNREVRSKILNPPSSRNIL